MASSNDITLKELFEKLAAAISYAFSKWLLVLSFAIIGAVLGLGYSLIRKTNYSAVSTFVLEDGSKMSSLGQYSDLAAIAGINLNSGSGLFQGDNILELYKSRAMIEKALLSQAVFDGKKELLIDRYIDFNELREKWKQHDDINAINFNGDPTNFNRVQDSIITDIVKQFNKKELTVNKLDKKLSIIVVEFDSKDEPFAAEFNKRLVDMVNNFYVQTKTKKSAQNVAVLQRQADSVKQVLNSSISGVASAIDAAPNANPQMLSLKVPSQKKQVDVQASSAVYAEIIKNLEISMISLREDVPLIQLIDQPVLPLENDRVTKLKGLIFGFILGGFITGLFFVVKKLGHER